MAKSENRQSQIPIITRRLKTFFKERHDVSLVFLFGSFVSKQTTAFSDIDVGIFFKKVPNFHEINDMKEDLTALLKKEVDLVVLNDASPVLKMQVLKKGVLIFQKGKNDFSLFYGDAVKQYDDLKIIRRKCEENILKGRIYA